MTTPQSEGKRVPEPRSLDRPQSNLPIQLTSFVGRDRELVELDTLLASTRALTIAGAGGCGKTRLALQLAARALDRYPGGAWWLELAPLSDPPLIESALATSVGVRPLPGQTTVEATISHLAAQRALVLLDNCEHVLEPCRQLAEALLHGCPDVTVVASAARANRRRRPEVRAPVSAGARRRPRCSRRPLPVVP